MAAPSPQQTQAINDAMSDLGSISKPLLTNHLKQLPNLLQNQELPEKLLAVTQGANDSCLLVATNLRIMMIWEVMFSFSGKVKARDMWWRNVTSVEWRPGLLRHHLVILMGRKKWDCEIPGILGQDRARQMAEYLQSKIAATHGSPSKPIAKDAKTAKAHAIEDMVRDLPLAGSEWKQLPDVLAQDEMPEQFLGAEYDDRNGLKVSSGENQIGLLAATDRRLIFIKKPPLLRRKVTEFPYDSIERVEFKKGLFRSQITVFASGREEIFKGFGSEVKEMAEYIEDKID